MGSGSCDQETHGPESVSNGKSQTRGSQASEIDTARGVGQHKGGPEALVPKHLEKDYFCLTDYKSVFLYSLGTSASCLLVTTADQVR